MMLKRIADAAAPSGRELSYNLSQGKLLDNQNSSYGRKANALTSKAVSIRELASEIRKGGVKCLRLNGFDHARDVQENEMKILLAALDDNSSIVEVTMAWSIQEQCMTLLLEKIAALPHLRCLCLKAFTWISEDSIAKILHNPALQELECQGVWVRTASGERQTVVRSLVQRDIVKCNISKLRLIRCSLRDSDCVKLCAFSRRYSNLEELSIKGNRFITGFGLASLMHAQVRRLDLSDCALCNADVSLTVIAGYFGSDGPEELVLARNEHISTPDSTTFLCFAEFCIKRLKLLDLSECHIQEHDLMRILELLQLDSCRLETFLCEGNFSMPVPEIAQLLLNNRTLSSISLSTSRDEYDSQFDKRGRLAQSLKYNYSLFSLEIYCCGSDIVQLDDEEEDKPDPTNSQIDFLLKLNRGGRKVFLEDGCAQHPAVFQEVLKKTTMLGDDVLFWFLRNGLSSHFERESSRPPPSAMQVK